MMCGLVVQLTLPYDVLVVDDQILISYMKPKPGHEMG